MTRPTDAQALEFDALASELHDAGRIVGLDVSSVRVLFRLKGGATLRVGWRPVGLELSLHQAGEDPDADHEDDERRLAEIRGDGLDPKALRRAFHMPENLVAPGCGEVSCGHQRHQHRKRGPDGTGYCTGIVPGTTTQPCRCTGYKEPDA